MADNQTYTRRRMRVTKLEARDAGQQVFVWLDPDLDERRSLSGIVLYGVSLICRGVDPPALGQSMEVRVDVR